MTVGKPLWPMLSFALPRVVGNVVQQLYTVADSMVVGNLIGTLAFASVGATGFLFSLVLSLIGGFVQGAGIVASHRFGAKDTAGLARAVAAGIKLCLCLGVLLTILGLFLARPVLVLMGTPPEILEGSVTYLTILFGGNLISMMNFYASSLLLSLGDSRSTLVSSIITCIVNVLLDLLFVGVFGWGIAGVAVATAISWTASLTYYCLKLRKILHLKRTDFSKTGRESRQILRLAAPMLFRNFIIDCGGLFVQSYINSFGALFVAGTAMSQKFFGIMEMAGGAMDASYSVFSAQNFGNRNMLRIREGLFVALRFSFIGGVCVGGLFILFGPQLLSILVAGSPTDMAEMLRVGYRSLVITAGGIPFLYLLYIFRAGIQGMGKTLIPTISGFLELGARLLAVAILPPVMGEWGIYIANPLGWIVASTLLIFGYRHHFKEEMRRLKAE